MKNYLHRKIYAGPSQKEGDTGGSNHDVHLGTEHF
jgi:hypothetical protein